MIIYLFFASFINCFCSLLLEAGNFFRFFLFVHCILFNSFLLLFNPSAAILVDAVLAAHTGRSDFATNPITDTSLQQLFGA